MTRHTHVETRDVPICDFCSGPGVAWRYPCSATITMAALDDQDRVRLAATSDDDWGACEACAAVVETKDPGKLAEHVVNRGSPEDPSIDAALKIPAFRAVALENLRTLYSRLLPTLGERDKRGIDHPGLRVRITEE